MSTGSLLYVLKFAVNNQWPAKALLTFVRDNTLLNEEHLSFIMDTYEKQHT